MRRRFGAAVAAVVMAAALVGPVGAITGGTPDGSAHPYVGLVAFYTAAPEHTYLVRCSGSLISPTVFLTAGHCAGPRAAGTPAVAQVWFEEHVLPDPAQGFPAAGGHVGIPHTYLPLGDVGVVVFATAIPTSVVSVYAELPAVGIVDTLRNKAPLDLVGYGVSEREKESGPPLGRWDGPRDRLYAPSEFLAGQESLAPSLLKHKNGPGGDSGGACFYDSGGPILDAGTRIVLATNSYVANYNCTGHAYGTRLDVPDRLAWIESYLEP